MIRNLIGVISALTMLLMLTLTNPGLKAHKMIVKERASTLINKQDTQRKNNIIDDLLNKGISRTNYILFSTTNLEYKGQKFVIGYGVLGNVFLNAKLDKVLM